MIWKNDRKTFLLARNDRKPEGLEERSSGECKQCNLPHMRGHQKSLTIPYVGFAGHNSVTVLFLLIFFPNSAPSLLSLLHPSQFLWYWKTLPTTEKMWRSKCTRWTVGRPRGGQHIQPASKGDMTLIGTRYRLAFFYINFERNNFLSFFL